MIVAEFWMQKEYLAGMVLNWKWEVLHYIVIYTEAWYHLYGYNLTLIYNPLLTDVRNQFGMDIFNKSQWSASSFCVSFNFPVWIFIVTEHHWNLLCMPWITSTIDSHTTWRLFLSYHIARSNKLHCKESGVDFEYWLLFHLTPLFLLAAEKAHYAARDPINALKKYMMENNLASESELKAIEKKIDEVIEDAVEFADASPHPPRSQLLENVFADPKGFGIGPDGRYRCEDPGFTAGTAQV